MFRDKSWARRAGVALWLVICLCGSTVLPPHADGADDIGCNPVLVTHDESAHYIAADPALAQGDADHCLLCHSLRSFHSVLDKFNHHDYAPRADHLHAAQIDRPALVEWTLVPGRAPPV
jgi:hypothetical protein